MLKYYVVEHENNSDFQVENQYFNEVNHIPFGLGIHIENVPEISIPIDQPSIDSSIVNNLGLLIFNPGLVSLLKKFDPNGFQLFPIQIQSQINNIGKYKIVNILKKIDALNAEKSKVEFLEPDDHIIFDLRELHLVYDNLTDEDVFF